MVSIPSCHTNCTYIWKPRLELCLRAKWVDQQRTVRHLKLRYWRASQEPRSKSYRFCYGTVTAIRGFITKTVDPIRSQRIQTSPIFPFYLIFVSFRFCETYPFIPARRTETFTSISTKWPGQPQFTTPANAVNRPDGQSIRQLRAIRWQVLRETRLIYSTIDDKNSCANRRTQHWLDHQVSYPHLANYNNVCK